MGRHHDAGVSEIIGTMLLIGFSVAFFAIVGLQVQKLPPPDTSPQVDLRVFGNSTNHVMVASLGGDGVPLATMEVLLDDTTCALTQGPADDADGTREDGNGLLETGERVVTSCAMDGGRMLRVVGETAGGRAVLVLAHLPGA